MTPFVVRVAPNGARRTKADHANLPITPAEIADEAVRCAEAGASVLHVHVRSDDGRHDELENAYLSTEVWMIHINPIYI